MQKLFFAATALLFFILPAVSPSASSPTATAASTATSMEIRPEWARYFEAFDVTGSFELYDLKANHMLYYNPERAATRFIPASTYKILNALIALETGVVTDENTVIKWDGTQWPIESWNHDQTLQSAIQESIVWYFQEVARRIGRERMQRYVDLVGYGNQDITGKIDSFWLDGALRISSDEQIAFLVRLYKGDLPFSERAINIVKKMLVVDSTDNYTLRAKTGWALRVTPQICWYVGYIETGGNVYFFAMNYESAHPDANFGDGRWSIAQSILQDLSLLPMSTQTPT